MPNGHIAPIAKAVNIQTVVDSSATNSWTYTNSTSDHLKVESLAVRYTSDANAGNRQIRMYLLSDEDVEARDTHAGAVQAASVDRHYDFSTGIFRETAFVDGAIQVPFPFSFYIPPGWKLKVADASDVSAADTMPLICLQFEQMNG